MALEKYEQITGKKHARACERTWEECAAYLDIMVDMDWSSENRYYWHELKDLWFNEYNKDDVLFDPTEFHDLFEINCDLLDENEDHQKKAALSLYEDMKKKKSLLSEKEESILYGAATDRELSYINRGGSTLSTTGETQLSERTWTSIKEQYDLAWSNAVKKYPTQFFKTDYVNRTSKELREHYKFIWIRSYYQLEGKTMRELDREWFSFLNKEGELISRSESLASQPDERYAASDIVPRPDDIVGIPERFADSLVSAWDDLQKKKKADSDLETPGPIPPFKNCSPSKDIKFTYDPMAVEKHERNCKSTPNKRIRIDEWTREEEIILFGVLSNRAEWLFLSTDLVEPKDNLQDIKEAFDIARKRYHKINGTKDENRACVYRSSQTLSKRIRILHEQATSNSPYQNHLRDMWNNKYNKDSCLLSADFFDDKITSKATIKCTSHVNELSSFELQVANANSRRISIVDQDLENFCEEFGDVFCELGDDIVDDSDLSMAGLKTDVFAQSNTESKAKVKTKNSCMSGAKKDLTSNQNDNKIKAPKFIETELKKLPGSGEFDSIECMIMLFYVHSNFDHPDIYSKTRECMHSKRSRASIRHKLTKVVHKYTGHKGSVIQNKSMSKEFKRIIYLEFWDMIQKAEEYGEGSMKLFAKRLSAFATKKNLLPPQREDK
eukprot:CAMPEP_0204837928 /NCGR_PEP_ID=MMETSP1346-20131115/29329_1 /ASSEMBLY_ACC=CAM_ASM_000771 /TAXON_ID=215587 /ORGANISM="Aplanochytrium stocchinoi, Strain GSBS06" /LENGTH=667 /DNA_ID=CAMNT_0051973659 /DNA_START=347 /DNA_END=2350 /DNA_ORIENTATION=+